MGWKVGIVSLGKAAAGQADSIELADEPMQDDTENGEDSTTTDFSPESSNMDVKYPLRPNLEVKLSLPKTITRREAERLSDFIRTLPFEGDGDRGPLVQQIPE
jgi:hypothetical protein